MRDKSPQQLPLRVVLNDDATFDNFYVPVKSQNSQALFALREQLQAGGEQVIFLWGGDGVGLSHLLQAACQTAEHLGLSAQYLPLRELSLVDPVALLDGLEQLDMVCLDDLQVVLGSQEWEQALFNFFNAMRDSGRHLLLAADCGPREIPVQLPDLQSRLAWGLTFQIQPLNDDAKLKALQLRARVRGMELADDVAQFILHRASRNMHELFTVLARLDEASLTEQRRLTIPFVKQTLGL